MQFSVAKLKMPNSPLPYANPAFPAFSLSSLRISSFVPTLVHILPNAFDQTADQISVFLVTREKGLVLVYII